METKTKSFGSMLREWERWFTKAAYPLVFIAPNNVICLFAGAAGMSVPAFFALNVSGTVARLYLIRRLGEAFERPIDEILDFIARYRVPLLIVSITFFTVVMVRELRQSTEELEALEDAIDDEAQE
jgi:membrane protein DedA with SNARE-associated domain